MWKTILAISILTAAAASAAALDTRSVTAAKTSTATTFTGTTPSEIRPGRTARFTVRIPAELSNPSPPISQVGTGAEGDRSRRSFDRATVVAQVPKRAGAGRRPAARPAPPRRLDANAIIRGLAPIDYLPEHSGKKRTVDLDIRFEINSSKLSRSAAGQLDELAAAINAPGLEGTRFRIAGHTDASGAAGYNKALSARRAAAVKAYLVRRRGIRPARLETIGWNEERLNNPINPDDADNRRVEVIALLKPRTATEPEVPNGSRNKKIDW